MQNLMSYSCSATRISYKCDKISHLSHLVTDSHFGLFGVLVGFWGTYLPLTENLTLHSRLATAISYEGNKISRISRIIFEIPFWGIFGFRATFGVFS